MAVADTIHEIDESALPNRTRRHDTSDVISQTAVADVLMTASLAAVAVTAAETTTEMPTIRSAEADALAAEDAAAETF
jgi:hypothetical protein